MTRDARPLHRTPSALAAVALGGIVGTASRWQAGQWYPTPHGTWPRATFAVNLAGAFVLGVLLEALARSGPDAGRRRTLRLLGGTGFCGSLTTYSALAVETDLLVRDGALGLAAAYLATTVVAGLACTTGGVALAAWGHRAAALPDDPDAPDAVDTGATR
ncbi:MAG: CrcB family protein [Kineosporiaceae bacterium]